MMWLTQKSESMHIDVPAYSIYAGENTRLLVSIVSSDCSHAGLCEGLLCVDEPVLLQTCVTSETILDVQRDNRLSIAAPPNSFRADACLKKFAILINNSACKLTAQ